MDTLHILSVLILSGSSPSPGSKFLFSGDSCRLQAVAKVVLDQDTFWTTGGPLSLQGVSGVRPWREEWGKPEIRWFKVENARPAYRNGPENPGWWARLAYVETPFDTGWTAPCDVRPTVLKGAPGGANLGTMRFRVQIRYGEQEVASPGAEAVEKRGISDRVHRLSIARDTSLVGLAYAWFGLPYIYGSASLRDQDPPEAHQAERFIGADCADLVVAVLRRYTGLDLPYRNSRAFHEGGAFDRYLVTLFRKVHPSGDRYVDARGRPVPVGPSGVKPGDLLVYDRHVALFSEDRPPRGVLDPGDLHIHTCNGEVAEDPLREGFDPPFDIRRWVGR